MRNMCCNFLNIGVNKEINYLLVCMRMGIQVENRARGSFITAGSRRCVLLSILDLKVLFPQIFLHFLD